MNRQISSVSRIRNGRLERLVNGRWIVVFTPPAHKLPVGVAIVGRA